MKTKRAGLFTKLVVLALLIATSIALLNLRGKLMVAQQQQTLITQQVDAQSQKNQSLVAAIAGKDDPERKKTIAREKLGLVTPGEIIFYDAAN